MAASYHVNGPVIPQTSTGVANAMEAIGVCEEGADLQIQIAQHDIKFDGAGGLDGFEAENIFLNAAVLIRFTLVPFDGAIINKIRTRAHAGGSAGTAGTMVMPGTLFGTVAASLMTVYLPTTLADSEGPWRFPTCRCTNPGSNRVSTKDTKPLFEFRAFVWIDAATATSISTKTLWLRTAPP